MTDLTTLVETLRLGRNLQLEPKHAMAAGDMIASLMDDREYLGELERDIAAAAEKALGMDAPLSAEGGLSVLLARFDALTSQISNLRTILVDYGAMSPDDEKSDPVMMLRFLLS